MNYPAGQAVHLDPAPGYGGPGAGEKEKPLVNNLFIEGLTIAACAVLSLRWSHVFMFLVFKRVAITTKTLWFVF